MRLQPAAMPHIVTKHYEQFENTETQYKEAKLQVKEAEAKRPDPTHKHRPSLHHAACAIHGLVARLRVYKPHGSEPCEEGFQRFLYD